MRITIMSIYRHVATSLSIFFKRSFLPVFAICFLYYSSEEVLLGDSALKTDQLYQSEHPKLEEKIPQDPESHDLHGFEVVPTMSSFIKNTEDLIDWAEKASEDKRCLLILLSSDSLIFHGVSEKGNKKLQENCYLLQAKPELVRRAYNIPLEEKANAIAVFACPMEDHEKGLIIINWVIITDKKEVVEIINLDKNLIDFFKELNVDVLTQMHEEENLIVKVEPLATHVQEI